jgi:hypothetical protein
MHHRPQADMLREMLLYRPLPASSRAAAPRWRLYSIKLQPRLKQRPAGESGAKPLENSCSTARRRSRNNARAMLKTIQPRLVHRLAYSSDVAAGQLAVFQGASEAPISELIRVERATRKNSQLAAAQRVALKMGRRPRCSSVTYRFRYAPSSRLAGGPF